MDVHSMYIRMYICTYMFLLCFVLFVWCVCVVFIFLRVLPASMHHLPSLLPLLWHTERLLAAQNPLSQADRPHQIFADAPPSHPVPPPENRPTQKAPERILHPHTLPNMQPLIRPPPPLFSKPSLCALHSEHFRQVPLVGAGCF